jgi:hypothetical protein
LATQNLVRLGLHFVDREEPRLTRFNLLPAPCELVAPKLLGVISRLSFHALPDQFRDVHPFSGIELESCSVSRDASPVAGRSYVYGRFTIQAEDYALANNDATMGFKLGCDDGQSYTIGFSRQPTVQLIGIAEATCAMTEIVYSDNSGAIKGRRLPPPGWRQPRRFAAGQAFYLGDYEAATTHEWKVLTTELRWALTSEENDYADTTRDLFAAYPAFAGMPTVDRGFVSAPPKAKPRKRPADVPSLSSGGSTRRAAHRPDLFDDERVRGRLRDR